MTHDPLCPYRPAQSGVCDRPFSDPNISCAVLHVSQPEIPCQCDLIARVRADTITRMEQSVKAVRDDTLDKVRDAVRELPCTKVISLNDETWHEPALIERGKVIAAIDTLLGEQ